jgi:superfamily II DNA or RNA helicase
MFAAARRILFTATPFRRDDREILGRFAYAYDLKRAYRDGVFGHIQFELVENIPAGDNRQEMEDIAIANAAERKLAADRDAGYDHLLMVRTDSKKRAADLVEVCEKHTKLRLRLIQGTHSLSHVRRILAALATNELDGIICVNMLGEGFDMPRLKVAAVHTACSLLQSLMGTVLVNHLMKEQLSYRLSRIERDRCFPQISKLLDCPRNPDEYQPLLLR